jgi:SAM-dependent methyltransferase
MAEQSILSDEERLRLAPSPRVRRFGREMVDAADGYPILDVACGGGRNGAWISHLGASVIGIDVNLGRIQAERCRLGDTPLTAVFRRIVPQELDLLGGTWPYGRACAGGIINIHFLHIPLLTLFSQSLIRGGILILETIENRGENYRELPSAGTLRATLEKSMEFLLYKEQKVGPADIDSVTVQVVARKC